MKKNKRTIGSDLAKVDAHIIQPEEYEEIPELTEEWFERASLYHGGKLIRRGQPEKSPSESGDDHPLRRRCAEKIPCHRPRLAVAHQPGVA